MNREILINWLTERRENCKRIAAERTGNERNGWIEDAVFFDWAISAVYNNSDSSGHIATGEGGDGVTGDTSDGYHTFNELYEHRHILFLSVLTANIDRAWRSKLHDDGTMFDGWFIAGLRTVTGQATYHLPIRMWSLFDAIPELEKAPPFDGHTAEDTLKRLRDDAYFGHRDQQKTAEPCGDE